MSLNEDIKEELTPFWKKAVPWAIVFSAGYVLGLITGLVA